METEQTFDIPGELASLKDQVGAMGAHIQALEDELAGYRNAPASPDGEFIGLIVQTYFREDHARYLASKAATPAA